MKIVIAGGSGQVGHVLSRAFLREGHEVVVLSRNPVPQEGCRMVAWDGSSVGSWAAEIDGAEAVINLAGRSVDCRYHAANRQSIMDSRVHSTLAIREAILRASRPPHVWLQASTATLYAHRYDAPNDEAHGLIGGDEPHAPDTWNFSIRVASAWEQAAQQGAALPGTRLVLLRSALTLSPDRAGVFDVLLGLVRHGLGGAFGDGKQFVSWIHDADFIRAMQFLLEDESIEGPINLSSPHPVTNEVFMRELRRAWGIRFGLPAACWMLEIGAFFLRTETELILKSRRVVPGRLLEKGFRFDFPEWPGAASDLCRRWRESRSH